MSFPKNYLDTIRERAKNCRVHQKFQMTGLLLSQILDDEKHKSLYMKLARQYDNDELLRLAKETAERIKIRNKGAYFMRILKTAAPKRAAKGV